MGKNFFSSKFAPEEEAKLRQLLKEDGFYLHEVEHAFWQAKKERVFITFYRSGKVLIQGRNADLYAKKYLSGLKSQQKIHGLESIQSLKNWIGTDESGKGDFFGPLVIAALYIDKRSEQELWLSGVSDSKCLIDQKIITLASWIRNNFQHSIVCYSPEKYNRLHKKYGNLNYILAKGHAQVIKNLSKKVNCSLVVTDKFADESLLQDEVNKGQNFKIIQLFRAEANLAVAGASILARATFISHLEKLSKKYNIILPPGASKNVLAVAKQFSRRYGKIELQHIAKIHFKTMRNI